MLIKTNDGTLYDQELVYIPKILGDAYMSYLSKIIANKKNMAIATPEHSAWLAASRITPEFVLQNEIDSDGTFLNFPISINDIIPENYCDINPREILDFRKKRKDERRELMLAYEDFCKQLCEAQNYEDFKYIWNTTVSKIQHAVYQYKKAADILRVSNWCGRISIISRIALNVMNLTNFLPQVQPLIEFGVGSLELGQTFLTNNVKIDDSPYNYFCQVNGYVTHKGIKRLRTNAII